ncbi:MAG TPA: ATP-dependent 6-phosphofructokinase [Rhodothermales bacterium]|nr:ATP-dependent 6-phosphofructokinase [Rhodothermales bacterium]
MSKSLRVGVLTGGGDCPGLNAVIRAVTKSLVVQHNAEVLGFEDGFQGLIEQHVRPLQYRDVSGILTRGGTILGTSNKANPFNYYRRGGADVSAEVKRYYKGLGLDALIVIGGDGTLSIAHGLQQMGINCVGVPKTIDNDLVGTSRTFGFDTAVSIVTEAIDRLHTTAQSHNRVIIVETMGRYAGWIALYAGVAGGADVILIPEFEYDIKEVARVCRERESGGQHFTIIAVAEGAKPKGGEHAVQEIIKESPDPIRLGGICKVLETQLEQHVRSEVRSVILGHTQRGGTPTAYDRNLATVYGSYAAAMVADGHFGRMVALQNNSLTSIALEEVANRTRTVPTDAPMIAAALAVGTSFGVPDLEIRLVGTEITPKLV